MVLNPEPGQENRQQGLVCVETGSRKKVRLFKSLGLIRTHKIAGISGTGFYPSSAAEIASFYHGRWNTSHCLLRRLAASGLLTWRIVLGKLTCRRRIFAAAGGPLPAAGGGGVWRLGHPLTIAGRPTAFLDLGAKLLLGSDFPGLDACSRPQGVVHGRGKH